MAVPTILVLAPPLVDNEENVRVRIWHNPAALANMFAVVVSPDGIEFPLTQFLRLVTTTSFTFVEMFIDFNALGDHTIYVRDNITTDWGIAQVRAVQWATNMDGRISSLQKQAASTQQVRSEVNRPAYQPPKGG